MYSIATDIFFIKQKTAYEVRLSLEGSEMDIRDLFGIRQSGLMEFRLGDVFQDSAILQWASEAAGRLLETDEELLLPEHQLLKKKLSIYIHGGTERLNL